MSDADLKLELFRLIDHQEGRELRKKYHSLISLIGSLKSKKQDKGIDLEEQYKLLSEDTNREKEAMEWIEGTLNHESL
jgi:hypothetical protein